MQDLSGHLPANPVTPSSMGAANTVTSDGTGFAGPGSPSELVKPGQVGQIPSLDAMSTGKPRSVVVSGDQGQGYAPWTKADGSAWTSAADDEYLPPRMMPARGQWNEV